MSSLRTAEEIFRAPGPNLAKPLPRPLARGVGPTNRSLRVVELVTLLIVASLIVAVVLPRCGGKNDPAPATHNQPPPAKTPPADSPTP